MLLGHDNDDDGYSEPVGTSLYCGNFRERMLQDVAVVIPRVLHTGQPVSTLNNFQKRIFVVEAKEYCRQFSGTQSVMASPLLHQSSYPVQAAS